jgi:hypothetical protein
MIRSVGKYKLIKLLLTAYVIYSIIADVAVAGGIVYYFFFY